mmetsp:Transcript_29636/g.58150  ORF Transcript_29636/g.58150 Transcript_29636/m.58150 type:complete len:123 (+) Transcript_29636:504-872(+)
MTHRSVDACRESLTVSQSDSHLERNESAGAEQAGRQRMHSKTTDLAIWKKVSLPPISQQDNVRARCVSEKQGESPCDSLSPSLVLLFLKFPCQPYSDSSLLPLVPLRTHVHLAYMQREKLSA